MINKIITSNIKEFNSKTNSFKKHNSITRWFHRTVSIKVVDPTEQKKSGLKKIVDLFKPAKNVVFF